jgi:hypothetical protein
MSVSQSRSNLHRKYEASVTKVLKYMLVASLILLQQKVVPVYAMNAHRVSEVMAPLIHQMVMKGQLHALPALSLVKG